jgi:hypothetical protein
MKGNPITVDVDLVNDPYGPVYRSGGLWGRGLSVGNSHMISDQEFHRNLDDVDTWIHETFHFYQVLVQGWQTQLWKGAMEQWFYKGNPYLDLKTNEGQAYDYERYGNYH